MSWSYALSSLVDPPDPQPVESYIVATNCSPAGWVSWRVKVFVDEDGMEMFWMCPLFTWVAWCPLARYLR